MMSSEPVEGVVYGHLFTFLPPTRASQFSEEMAIDNRPTSPLNYTAVAGGQIMPTYISRRVPIKIFDIPASLNLG